jgi:hypothetical protein
MSQCTPSTRIVTINKQTNKQNARHWWFLPVILATWEAEIRGITVRDQPRQIVQVTLFQKYPTQGGEKESSGGSEFKYDTFDTL